MFNSNIGSLLKEAKNLSKKMKESQENLAQIEVTGESGAGLVSVQMTGEYGVKHIAIDDTLLSDKTMLTDLVAAAFNDAINKIKSHKKSAMPDMPDFLKSLNIG